MPKQIDYHAMVRKMIKNSDVVVEVVDARFPALCRVKKYERMVQNHPRKSLLIAMNKVDLIPNHVAKEWKSILQDEGLYVIATSARERLSTSILKKAIIRAAPKDTFYITACFIGLPNTGKSALINILKGRSSAGVAPIPGYTKALQVLRITTRLRIFDTPGVIPPQISKTKQILLGVVRPEQLADTVKAAWALVHQIEEMNPGAISQIYRIDFEDPIEFLEKFAEKRNRRKKGGELDIDTAANIFLNEYIQGKIPVWEDPKDYLQKKKEQEEKEEK